MGQALMAALAGDEAANIAEHEALVPWPAWAYAGIAFGVLLVLLLVVTRLNLDR